MDASVRLRFAARVVATLLLGAVGAAGAARTVRWSLDATTATANFGHADVYPYRVRSVSGFAARAAALANVPEGRRFRAVLPTFGAVPETLLSAEPNAAVHVFTDDAVAYRYAAAVLCCAVVPRVVEAVHAKSGAIPARSFVEAVTTPEDMRRLAGVPPGRALYILDVGLDRLKVRPTAARLLTEGLEAALWVVP